MKKILRVFPTQTNQTPLDDLCFFTEPGLFVPDHDEVHISCVFTWDQRRSEALAEAWHGKVPVKTSGPAYDDPGGEFMPGLYTRKGITHTSRGCPNNCAFCFIPSREGKLRELEVKEGNEIQDNNFLACSNLHKEKVYAMLSKQKEIKFIGGLEPGRLSSWDIEEMRKLRIKELWLACDTKGAIKTTVKAIEKLRSAGFSQNHIRCYVLIGDNMVENEARLFEILGTKDEPRALPFAQLFQPPGGINYSKEWKQFARRWSRPAIYKSLWKEAEVIGQ